MQAAYEAADEDMFASDDEDKGKEAAAPAAGGGADPTAAHGGGSAQPAAAGPPATKDATDYASWPIKELRRFLTGVHCRRPVAGAAPAASFPVTAVPHSTSTAIEGP